MATKTEEAHPKQDMHEKRHIDTTKGQGATERRESENNQEEEVMTPLKRSPT